MIGERSYAVLIIYWKRRKFDCYEGGISCFLYEEIIAVAGESAPEDSLLNCFHGVLPALTLDDTHFPARSGRVTKTGTVSSQLLTGACRGIRASSLPFT